MINVYYAHIRNCQESKEMETYPQRIEIYLLIFQLKERQRESGMFKENTGKGVKKNLSALHQNNKIP